MVLCTDPPNVQAEADNLDCVTKSALLAQENQHLKEKLETQSQQMLHVQQEVCSPRVPILLQSCSVLALTLQCTIASIANPTYRLQSVDLATKLISVVLCDLAVALRKL